MSIEKPQNRRDASQPRDFNGKKKSIHELGVCQIENREWGGDDVRIDIGLGVAK